MSHLTAEQFVDALEHRATLPRRVAEHLAACQVCQQDLATLDEAHQVVRDLTVPEPSPLFWDHFSRRVRAATSLEPVPHSTALGRFWAGWWRALTAVMVAAAAFAMVFVFRPALMHRPGTGAPQIARAPASNSPEGLGLDDASLDVVAVLAADLRTDDLQQLTTPTADAAGAAMEELTPAQCEEMIRLIKTQMGGTE